MTPAQTPDVTKHHLETLLIERCWKDPVFKKQVLANPKSMFEEFLGQKLPENFNVVVHEDDRNTLHFTLPPTPPQLNELSDEELERVAGGTEFWVVGATAASLTVIFGAGAVSAAATIGGVVGGLKAGW